MTSRWIIAGAAALALGLLTIPVLRSGGRERLAPSSSSSGTAANAAEGGQTCDAEAGKGRLDFVVNDMHKAPLKLADYKGKVVLLNFWATWCGPCKEEIPDFVKIYDQYKDKGFVILGVSVDDSPEQLQAFMKEYGMNYPVLQMTPEFEDAFGPFYGYPTSFVVARDGTICLKHLGPLTHAQAEQEIKSLL